MTAFGPRTLLTTNLRVVQAVCGDHFCELLDGSRCPQLPECKAARKTPAGLRRGPECIAGERRNREFMQEREQGK
jgi:hypothetical protein